MKTTQQSNLDKLIPTGDAILSRTDDGFVTLTSSEHLEAIATYPEQMRIPLKMDLIARTDSTNIRLKCGKGQIILNWECNPEELHVHDPLTGNPYGAIEQGLIPTNQFIHIRWIMAETYMLLQVDGEVRLFSENEPYMKELKKNDPGSSPACTVGVASAFGSVVTVKEFHVTEWGRDNQSDKPLALLIHDPVVKEGRVSGIGPSAPIVKLNPGQTCTLQYSIFPKSAKDCKITWTANNDLVKITDCAEGNLTITAIDQGNTTIRGEIENGTYSALYHVKSFIPEFRTNLEQLQAVSGKWEVENGLVGDGWDNCYMLSSAEADHVIYECDMSIESAVAAGLVFRASSDAEHFYCVSISPGGSIKLWTPHRVITEKPIDIQKRTEYRLKVVADGDHISVYLDGMAFIDVIDSSYSSGSLGLHVCFGTCFFQDVKYWKTRDNEKIV
ncbi:Ig-like domain-containing protein [Paenibacillus sp. GYB003]|uniref:Ig-like domain-containing protein n=1 Tax=Paenibacillus sp. GYB003 TaxID=2994392 RepID=UPI002F96B7D8